MKCNASDTNEACIISVRMGRLLYAVKQYYLEVVSFAILIDGGERLYFVPVLNFSGGHTLSFGSVQ